jgi:2-octaprenylphenol hydroxylase
VTGSIVLIGDAAHSIHPLAGQGINLGFADADAFCEEITNAYQNKINIDKHLVLKRYEVRRKNMNLLMLKSMDFFVNLFKSNNLYIKLIRNFGLSGINKTQFIKRFFINHASGKNKI